MKKCPLTKASCPLSQSVCKLQECDILNSFALSESGIIMLILDMKCNIRYFNNALMKLTGRNLDDCAGKNWLDVFIDPGDVPIITNVANRLHIEDTTTFTNDIVDVGGNKHLVAWHNYKIENGVTSIICIGIEITKSRYVVEELVVPEEQKGSQDSVLMKALHDLTASTNRLAMIRQLNPIN